MKQEDYRRNLALKVLEQIKEDVEGQDDALAVLLKLLMDNEESRNFLYAYLSAEKRSEIFDV